MKISSNEKLAQYIREQEHTWGKIYDTGGQLVATFSQMKSPDNLALKITQFLEQFPGSYCFDFKKGDTASTDVICRVQLILPDEKDIPSPAPMQGYRYSDEDIQAKVNEGVKAELDRYKRETEMKELREENRRLKTSGGKFHNALAAAFDIWFEHRGQGILAGFLGQPGAQLQGTPHTQEQHTDMENQEYKLFEELEPEDQQKIITGINYILAQLTPEEVLQLGVKISEKPEYMPFVRNFLNS